MSIEIELICPFDKKCEEIKNNKMYRCHLYTKVAGKDPQSEKIMDHWACSLAWLPILLIENSQTNRGQTIAIQQFEKQYTQLQAGFNKMAAMSLQTKLKQQFIEEESHE